MEACLPGVRVELAQGAQESGQSPLQAEILGCIEYSIQPQIHPLRNHPQATTFPLGYPVKMGGERLHELQEEGRLFLHPPTPVGTLTDGGGATPLGPPSPKSWP